MLITHAVCWGKSSNVSQLLMNHATAIFSELRFRTYANLWSLNTFQFKTLGSITSFMCSVYIHWEAIDFKTNILLESKAHLFILPSYSDIHKWFIILLLEFDSLCPFTMPYRLSSHGSLFLIGELLT